MPQESDDLLAQIKDLEKSGPRPQVVLMKTTATQIIGLNIKQIRTAVNANPTHPLSPGLARSVEGKEDNQEVFVDRVDIQGILENKEVIEYETTEQVAGLTRTIVRKKLGSSLDSPKAPKAKTGKAPVT